MNLVALVGTLELIVAVVGAFAFVVLYTRQAPWWRSEVGRWLVTYPLALGLLLVNGVVGRIAGDYPGRQAVNLSLFAVVAGSTVWSCTMLLRIRRREKGANEMTTPVRTQLRPTPVADAAGQVQRGVGLAGTIVTALVGWGVVTAAQGDATVGLLGLIPGAVTAVSNLLVAFGVVRRSEPLVTPVSDPQDDAGRSLVPRVG